MKHLPRSTSQSTIGLLAAAFVLLVAAACAREEGQLPDRIEVICTALGDWQSMTPEARARILTGVGGLEDEALARTEFLLTASNEAIEETIDLAEFLGELTGGDSQRLVNSPACREAIAELEAQQCPLAVAGAEDAQARQQLAELALAMQERCLLETEVEDALPLPEIPALMPQ